MDACTRPSHTRRQTRKVQNFRLAALFSCVAISCLLTAGSALPAAQPELAPENEETGSISPSAEHEVAVAKAAPGQEMATLSARLTDQSAMLLKNVTWHVTNAAGDTVFDGAATTAAVALQPGYYAVEAHYGAVELEESFTLLEGTRMDMRFVLNAGALRVLPRIRGLISPDIGSSTRVYALTGKAKGKMVRETATPGEIINLTAGQYRVESRLITGNAVAVMDVKVTPGIMSAVEIDHRAGLARLSYVGAPDSRVEWEIRRGTETELSNIIGLNANIALQPGDYVAIARIGNERLTASFQIKEGEARDIMLGN
ncbi:MAG: hypothetical protein IPM06_16120 [Rhizobiales bacterium]|nr:hypothetical protein [Hyphomicrobiales bacterium]